MKLTPLFDRVVIRPLPHKKTTQSGLILPEASGERPAIGKVIFAGDGGETDGKTNKMYIKVGDSVMYTRYGGIEFKFEDEDLVIIRQTDILAKIGE